MQAFNLTHEGPGVATVRFNATAAAGTTYGSGASGSLPVAALTCGFLYSTRQASGQILTLPVAALSDPASPPLAARERTAGRPLPYG